MVDLRVDAEHGCDFAPVPMPFRPAAPVSAVPHCAVPRPCPAVRPQSPIAQSCRGAQVVSPGAARDDGSWLPQRGGGAAGVHILLRAPQSLIDVSLESGEPNPAKAKNALWARAAAGSRRAPLRRGSRAHGETGRRNDSAGYVECRAAGDLRCTRRRRILMSPGSTMRAPAYRTRRFFHVGDRA